jgi:hypothetical protein
MKTSPLFMGCMYMFMGIIFTYFAIENAEETIWTMSTILLMLVATFDFGIAIRMFGLNRKLKRLERKR